MSVELKNFLGVYQAIESSIDDEELKYSSLESLDNVAEKILTFAEYTQYYKKTSEYMRKRVEVKNG